MNKFNLITAFAIIVVIIISISFISSFQGTSDSYSTEQKIDSITNENSSSTNFLQRFVGGISAVSQYVGKTTKSVIGRFGILADEIQITYGNLTACRTITTANSVYDLNNSVMSNGTCFTIAANNVTINCNGYSITYANKTAGYAVTSNGYYDGYVKNCLIYQGNQSRASSYSLYFRNCYRTILENNTINTYGILATTNYYNHPIILNADPNSIIKNNTIATSGRADYGIYIVNSKNTSIDQNTLTSSAVSAHPIFITGINSSESSINNNLLTINGNSTYGIVLSTNSSYGQITNNVITSTKNANYGIYLTSYINNTIINYNSISMLGTNSYGILINSNSKYNNLTNNNITSIGTGSRGLYLASNSNNNLIVNSTIVSFTYPLIISGSGNNSLYNNIFNSTTSSIVSISNANSSSNILNTTKTLTTNIISGSYLGGNYWINSIGSGYSQKCADANNDGICDLTYTINAYNKDFLALTTQDTVPPAISLYSPMDESVVNGRVTIRSNYSDNRGVIRVNYQYSNSTVSWTNISGCNYTIARNYCYWTTTTFSNNAEGYDIMAIAYDAAGNSGNDTFHYLIDRTKPIVYEMNVTYPTNQTSARDSQNITINAVVTDSPFVGAGINYVQANISKINSTQFTNLTFISGSRTALQNSTWEMEDINVSTNSASGNRDMNIRVYDAAIPTNNLRTGDLWRAIIDNLAPTYSNLSTGETVFNNTLTSFFINVRDNINLSYFIFSTNYSGDWVNNSRVSLAGTGTIDYIDYSTTVYTGNFSYKFYIFDDAGNMNETTTPTIEVQGDPPVPTVYLVSPENNANQSTTENIQFKYYYSGANMSNCSLFINDNLTSTQNAPIELETSTFTTNLNYGNYTWFVSCSQIKEEEEENISIDYSSETRLLAIEQICTGIWVSWGEWGSCSLGVRSRTLVDTSGCIGSESEGCSDGCPGCGGCSPHWSNWGDWSTCNLTRIQYSLRDNGCGTIESQFRSCNCTSNWICGLWENCINNTRKRICNDQNNCNDLLTKPEESRPCTNINCTERWQCKWSRCDSQGYRYPESCIDVNNCGTKINYPEKANCNCLPNYNCYNYTLCNAQYNLEDILNGKPTLNGTREVFCEDLNKCENKSIMSLNCSLKSQISSKKTKWCNETYIEIYETQTNRTVSRIKEYVLKGIKKLDIALSVSDEPNKYCSHCFDKIKDFDETSIDCGGSECPSCIIKGKYFDWLLELIIILWAVFIGLVIYLIIKRKQKRYN
ncbi:MAG: right-handed parallel beta-helix repeat-containing protein [Candidatus Pacearchaeota archaeon]|jgi:hypothetical protein